MKKMLRRTYVVSERGLNLTEIRFKTRSVRLHYENSIKYFFISIWKHVQSFVFAYESLMGITFGEL